MYRTGVELCQYIYKKAMAESAEQRKDYASKMLDYYNNNQLDYIMEYVKERDPKGNNIYPVGLNIVRKIIRNLAMVYIKDAVRTIDGTEQDQKIYSEIETTSAIAVKMKQANRMSKLLGTVLLKPVWRNGHMDLDVLTPDVLDVETGYTPEDLQAVQVTHYDPVGDVNETSYSIWTSETITTMDALGNFISEEINPYGILPFIPCWSDPPTDYFWQRGAHDLILSQDAINRMLTLLGYAIDFQGFSLCYVKSESQPKKEDQNIKLGPRSVMFLSQQGDVGFASPDAPINEVLAAISFLMKQAAITNGLSASIITTDDKQMSGVSRITSNREMEELRRDDIALFTEYERKLFNIFRIIWNYHNPDRQMSNEVQLLVNFYDPQPVIDARDQVQVWSQLMEMGIISPVDIIMERDPDLTREEATEKLYNIREEIQEYTQYVKDPIPATNYKMKRNKFDTQKSLSDFLKEGL